MNVTLCREDGVYQAGGELMAKWRVRRISMDDLQSIEVSVLWHTEGKGDEDLHVHHFHRIVESQIRQIGFADEQAIRCVLPASPLSYQGHLITVRWCIRMRLFMQDGRKIMAEQPFHLVAPGAYPIATSAARNRTGAVDPDDGSGVSDGMTIASLGQ
ncbi:hypothetical protein K227x_24660 [Rubripirellula lacrimiformis]|uniref:Uncharacterized protein n=1 Tax=Rubripirellula lacrimiformis TaxID=1930273 RepID=A0A517NAN6_9BACT|nr:hypothetical protein [Rubripirellula lacrimiformis]QDT04078.1 hypothetical protein K227x_24660 [Rubripirellula lacrimiformis]